MITCRKPLENINKTMEFGFFGGFSRNTAEMRLFPCPGWPFPSKRAPIVKLWKSKLSFQPNKTLHNSNYHSIPIIYLSFSQNFPIISPSPKSFFYLVITCAGDCNKALPLKLLKACVTFGGPAVSPRTWQWGSPGKRRFHEISYWTKQLSLGTMLIFLGWSWWKKNLQASDATKSFSEENVWCNRACL